ncbi:MAG: hypothetical protein KGL31_07545 [candidate division NC10 bacterium]|nr:hypothetical protein [candidate division NC10 bacterium]MDE2321756.1 hypothetical protein [candidate division NC10 bacterium]
MLNAQERMQFVVGFAGMDLDRLRPGDWSNLRDDFTRYLHGQQGEQSPAHGPVHFSTFEHLPSKPYTEEDFRQLQGAVQAILHNVVDTRRMRPGQQVHAPLTPLQIRCRLLPLDAIGLKGKTHLGVDGPARDVFLLSVFLLFAYEKTGKIGQCPACHALFLPVKKQAYCSKRCQMRVYMQQRRQQEHVKEQQAEQAHARYANTRKRQLSEKVYVARRPRAKKGGTTR